MIAAMEGKNIESRVAVVGGGVAGCAAAILLRAQGHEVTLFEAVADPQPVGAGLLLQPTGQAVLQRLGLLDEVLAHGAPVRRLFGDNAAGRTVLNLDYGRFAPGCFGLGIQRGTLFGLLWRRMAAAGTAGAAVHARRRLRPGRRRRHLGRRRGGTRSAASMRWCSPTAASRTCGRHGGAAVAGAVPLGRAVGRAARAAGFAPRSCASASARRARWSG